MFQNDYKPIWEDLISQEKVWEKQPEIYFELNWFPIYGGQKILS